MRGIQIMCVPTSGAAAESDDLVKDLENWFEDHQQMCRLMTTALPSDVREVASSLDRLRASVDSGQRLLGRLKSSVQNDQPVHSQGIRTAGSIPLSGMNRFEESRTLTALTVPSNAPTVSVRQGFAQGGGLMSSQAHVLSLNSSLTGEQSRMQPSRTYIKKSGGGA